MRKSGVTSKKAGSYKSKLIDITIPLRNNMLHWPTDPFVPEVKRIWEVDKGDRV
jgi:kynurenine formamidase